MLRFLLDTNIVSEPVAKRPHDLVLVTANVKDFVRFEGLMIENWLA